MFSVVILLICTLVFQTKTSLAASHSLSSWWPPNAESQNGKRWVLTFPHCKTLNPAQICKIHRCVHAQIKIIDDVISFRFILPSWKYIIYVRTEILWFFCSGNFLWTQKMQQCKISEVVGELTWHGNIALALKQERLTGNNWNLAHNFFSEQVKFIFIQARTLNFEERFPKLLQWR